MSRSKVSEQAGDDEGLEQALIAHRKMLLQGRSFSGRERNVAYLNLGQSTHHGTATNDEEQFANVSGAIGIDYLDDGRGLVKVDWDGDGDLDIVGAATWDDDISWFENNGSESFTEHIIDGNLNGAWDVYPVDLDEDGDLDILTFKITGGFIEFHKNLAMETIGSCDTILFELSESCWGNFYEGLNNYTLNCQNCQCPPIINHPNAKQKHAGSTLLLTVSYTHLTLPTNREV